jgi:hypothetical protein
MKMVAAAGVLENFTFCLEPDTIVAQLEVNKANTSVVEMIVFLILNILVLINL